MYSAYPQKTILAKQVFRKFQRRDYLPMVQNILWKINSGMVRAITVHKDGTVTTLGLWGVGDIVGYPLPRIDSYQIECLEDVEVDILQQDDCLDLDKIVLSHLHQSQALLIIRHGSMSDRFEGFLIWFAQKFGKRFQDGYYIPNSLTHQDVAEAIDSTRVTVSRLIRQFEQQEIIQWSRTCCLLYDQSSN